MAALTRSILLWMGPLVDPCDCSYKNLGYVKGGKICVKLNDYELSKNS